MAKKDPVEKKPVKKPRAKKESTAKKSKVEVVEEVNEEIEKSNVEKVSAKAEMKIEVIEPEPTKVENNLESKLEDTNNNFETELKKPTTTKSWAAATEENLTTDLNYTENSLQHNLNPTPNSKTATSSTFLSKTEETVAEREENSFDAESVDVSDSELNKFTSANDESFFEDNRAMENNSKLVKDCNEKELLEVLWKRGKDNLNIALRMQVVKLYRMLNGERLHKERPTRQKNNKENFSQNTNARDFKNKGKFRREDFPSRSQKDSENNGKFQKDNSRYKFNEDNEDNSVNDGRWNRKRPPYRGRVFDQVAKTQ